MTDEWSTDPPTEFGLYWAINNGGNVEAVRLAWRWGDPDGVLSVRGFGDGLEVWRKLEPDDYTHWIGPIHQPTAPPGVGEENRERYLNRERGKL